MVFGAMLILFGCFLYLNPQIPSAARFKDVQLQTPLRIYSKEGLLLAEYGNRRRIPIPLTEIPEIYVKAVLNTEDKRFYAHAGVDLISLLTATSRFIMAGRIRGGGSTITMQLARNLSLSREQTFIRKFKEILLALKLERELSKSEILELYLNLISFGKRAYGAEAAAQTYYGKPLGEINLSQMAMLAGIPQAPTAGNPINGPARALQRRNLVLLRMLEQDSITKEEYEEAVATPITASLHSTTSRSSAPYFAEEIRADMVRKFGTQVYENDYEVHTTLNADMQIAADEAVRQGVYEYDLRHGYRGAEGRLEVPEAFNQQLQAEGGELTLPDVWREPLLEAGTVLDLVPAVVARVAEQSFEAFLVDGTLVTVEREGFRWARRHIDSNTRGRTPPNAAFVVQPGFLIRLRQQEDAWVLRQLPKAQAALVALSAYDGAVLAMTGGFSFHQYQFNHAMRARRQPGSSFKPFIYAAALNAGITPADIFNDAPMVFDDELLEDQYRPRNSSGDFRGPTRVREAFYRSINLVSMRILLAADIQPTLDYLQNFGFNTKTFPANLQLAVGGGTLALTPMEMARAYTIFANGGHLVEPNYIERIERTSLGTIEEYQPAIACSDCADGLTAAAQAEDDAATLFEDAQTANLATIDKAQIPIRLAPRAIDERIAFQIKSFMRDVIKYGTGRRARSLKRTDLAGKTGTTDSADLWFNGFNNDIVVCVWFGFSDNSPVGNNEFGSTAALPIWINFMDKVLPPEVPKDDPLPPKGLVQVLIDPSTGSMASPNDPDAEFEWFRTENAPFPNTPKQRQTSGANSGDIIDPADIF